MKSFVLIISLSLFFSLFAQASEYSGYMNYRDPVDGQSLHGWHGPLEDFKNQLPAGKNYVIAVLHKPVNAFLFQDIYWFRGSVLAARKQLRNDSHGQLGHFQVAWSCRVPGKTGRYYGMTGQTGEQTYQGKRMLLELGYGMSLMFANFTDGYLQSSEASAVRVWDSPDDHGFSWVAFEISDDDCANGIYFLDRYIKSEAYQNFSFVLDPNKLEGGGCTSFASELLFQFGMMRATLINAWKTQFKIPWYYIANRQRLPENTELPTWMFEEKFTENRTDMFQMGILPVVSRRSQDVVAEVYDPELITFTLDSMIRRAQMEKPQLFPDSFALPLRKAFGLRYGANGKARQGGRRDSIFIDQNLHWSFARLYNYVNHPQIELPALRYSQLNGVPGVIFESAVW